MLSESLEGHPGLESEAVHLELQSTLASLERGYYPVLFCTSLDLHVAIVTFTK